MNEQKKIRIGEERKDCYKNHVFCLNILFLTEKKNTIRAFWPLFKAHHQEHDIVLFFLLMLLLLSLWRFFPKLLVLLLFYLFII